MVDYLCGILDVAGELMRYAMNDVSAGHLSTIDHVVHFLRRIYCQLINIGNSINSKELTNKIRVLHQCIIKVIIIN
jgi:predicted translin family RNA/ssDNA-binding protein